jgi:hypothetical protein
MHEFAWHNLVSEEIVDSGMGNIGVTSLRASSCGGHIGRRHLV